MLVLNYLLSNSFNRKFFGAVLVLLPFLFGCSKEKETNLTPLEERGRLVYNTNCISCHNSDPEKPGPLGPEVAGSSLELLSARTLHQSYPAGYKPKRDTHLMPVLPFVEKDLPAIHAYLNLVRKR